MATVEKLENQIRNSNINLKNNKKQTNEDMIYHVLSLRQKYIYNLIS